MNQKRFISQTYAVPGWQIAAPDLRVKLKIKGGVQTADAVYTNAPTQPQIAQASGLCIARGNQNTHGVRTNG
ncbi:hypothetical protein I5192_03555 [Ruegeria sp. SCSIO 43209]|uniref:hypothetical protein n=1 Tax=Ruegeria sp. SCSIO 43209 TaxID=2793010 RepID=UPI0014810C88|nr:hypothetical protein [Ruegeria sp. SCSIO 43209]UAB89774.1 hypothetical protein I5192_03555 [Ruegeria sp. SCSIO 43209]